MGRIERQTGEASAAKEQARQKAEVCLIIGDGPDKWNELQELWDIADFAHDVCCVNRSGLKYPCEFRYWVSFHADELVGWARKRPGAELWSVREYPWVTTWPVDIGHGSSSMVAAQYALGVWGYKRIVLVGCPMNGGYTGYYPAWQSMKNLHGARIRAMSGNTHDLFGKPDHKFIIPD